jgi:TrmH family RNA methyltransferase
VATHLVDDRTARALGDTVTPPGLVAVCRQVDVPLTDVLDRRPTTVVVAVGIGEPGNAGTVIRLADALGADAVIFAGDTVDPHNGKCVRASAGSVFHVPVVRARSIDAALDELDAAGLTLLATTADGELSLDDADAVLAAPSAWLFGSEAHGLDAAVVARADHRVRIPIEGRAESLNLATAAAICLYAAARGRRAASSR